MQLTKSNGFCFQTNNSPSFCFNQRLINTLDIITKSRFPVLVVFQVKINFEVMYDVPNGIYSLITLLGKD